jgi:hypothetical protein
MSIHVFGIRHHGPGGARSLRATLETLQPDIVLVEGPPDAQDVLPLIIHQDMQPPVALLIYAPDNPKHAVYYPFTTFSPEWQALRYAIENALPARFMDLPQAIQLAKKEIVSTGEQDTEPQSVSEQPPSLEDDPLAQLAQAAGYTDYERWWEEQIEQRHDVTNLFESIMEAMSELRMGKPPKDEEEAQREAHMRQTIRAAQREGFQRLAVVCGAWHAPMLQEYSSAKEDAALLQGLKRTKVEATWIPWTNSRLSYRSGYGAGVMSPGWYEHLWTAPDRISIRWIANAAHLLREQGMDTSSASVIEAVRLGDSLAALRDLPMPGLAELHESIETVLCHGNATPMDLIREKLEIGEKLGQVPAETPAVPLQHDLETQQRKVRLKPSAEIIKLDLDLRKETDRARSQLFHRLRLLNIPWGELQRVGGTKGTFHENWQIQWRVEFAVAIVEANIWGNTVEVASTGIVHHKATTAQDLPALTELLDAAVLAELPAAIDDLLQAIQQRAAISADVQHLMGAMLPLARVARYGNVRQTKTEHIVPIIHGLFERMLISLPGACSSLDDDAARQMVDSINKVQESVSLLEDKEQRNEWLETLRMLAERESVHGLLRGRCCRLLLEQNVLDEAALQHLTGLALSPATPAPESAAWIEGVLGGSGLLVLHQDDLWRALDHWLADLSGDVFDTLLPILRRAFSNFHAPERRKMGEKVKNLHASVKAEGRQTGSTADIDTARADRILPLLIQIMGGANNEH